jgi:hypothetical protein
MARVTACRGPFTDPRDGRILRAIRLCSIAADTDVLSSAELMGWAFGMERELGRLKGWHYESLRRGLRKVAVPIGRRSGKGALKGRPMWWRLGPARMRLRWALGRWERQ